MSWRPARTRVRDSKKRRKTPPETTKGKGSGAAKPGKRAEVGERVGGRKDWLLQPWAGWRR